MRPARFSPRHSEEIQPALVDEADGAVGFGAPYGGRNRLDHLAQAYVTGLSNVRDVIPFPRTPGHARY